LVIVILICLFAFWIFADILGYKFPPLFVILYTGIDLAIFMVFLLYVKDRRLVEAVILDILERSVEKEGNIWCGTGKITGDFDELISALSSPDENTREEAISALSLLKDERIVFPLITSLRDESPYVRRRAVEALKKTHSPKTVKPLIETLTDNDRYVRESAAEVLGHLGTISMPYMIKRISDPDWRVRMGIAIAFRVSTDSPDTDLLIRMLFDESMYVRREVVKTLGRIGDTRIMPYLIQATNDPDSGVRIRAIRAVKKLGTPEEIEKVLKYCMHDPDGTVRILAKEG
jgi:HEAT repeat protein